MYRFHILKFKPENNHRLQNVHKYIFFQVITEEKWYENEVMKYVLFEINITPYPLDMCY